MANKLYEENDISAIATAIRTKEGAQAGGTMTVAQMPTRIANLTEVGIVSVSSVTIDT